mmetsp:Transcript_13891/g.19298  ORF Transcript_13891/g.19298 Transcript_13891/m.19298 type:complete len:272 (+) Transcript_13891:638-1453(+)
MTTGPALTQHCLVVGSSLGKISVWDLRYSLQVRMFCLPPPSDSARAHYSINSLELSETRKQAKSSTTNNTKALLWAAVGGNGGGITGFDLESGEPRFHLRDSTQTNLKLPHLVSEPLQSLCRVSGDAKLARDLVYVKDLNRRTAMRTLPLATRGRVSPNDPKCLMASADGRRIVTGCGDVVRIWDVEGNGRSRRLQLLPGPSRRVSSKFQQKRALLESRRITLETHALTGGGVVSMTQLGEQHSYHMFGRKPEGLGAIAVGCRSGRILVWA